MVEVKTPLSHYHHAGKREYQCEVALLTRNIVMQVLGLGAGAGVGLGLGFRLEFRLGLRLGFRFRVRVEVRVTTTRARGSISVRWHCSAAISSYKYMCEG